MKTTLIFLSFIAFSAGYVAQCSDCSSLAEALKDPLRVTHLDLSNQGLTAVPQEVNQFIHLQTLDLSENRLTELQLSTQFNELHHLNLNGNVGLDPWKMDLIGNAFPQIVRLELERCKLPLLPTGLDQLTHLTILDLSDNDLAFVPEELEQLTQLSMLDLSNNQLTEVKYVLGTLWNLSSLDVSGNKHLRLTEVLQSVSMNTKLYYLAIDGDQLTKDAEKLLKSAPLKTLHLFGLKENEFPKELTHNTSISSLILSDAVLTDQLAPELAKLKQLTELTLDNCTVPANLDQISQLDKLILHSNNPVPTEALQQLDFLDQLDIIQTSVTADQAKTLAQELPKTTIISTSATASPAFVSNTIEPIATLETTSTVVSGTGPSTVNIQDISLDIPAGAFLTEAGQPYSGEVNLAVKIYDDALDIALDGAPMTYTENGRNEVFASAGMVDIQATDAAGNALSTNPDNLIRMAMPDRLPEMQSDLFFYNPELNNWTKSYLDKNKPAYVDSLINARIDSINRLDLIDFVNYQSIPRLYSLRETKKRWDPAELTFRSYRANKDLFANRKDRKQVLQYNMDYVGKLIGRTSWKIDTLLTPDMAQALKSMRRSYQIPQRNHSKKNSHYLTQARVIRNLAIAPDFVNDNYRLQFLYKDSLVSLPVYINSSGKNQSVMKIHARFQRQLAAAQKKDRKNDEAGKRLRASKAKRFGAQNRADVIIQVQVLISNQISSSFSMNQQYRNRLFIVPLLTFGLANCDAMMRPVQPDYYQLQEILTDQRGNTYKRPEMVRAVYNNMNTYLQVNSDQIPDYPNSTTVVIIPLNKTEIGVVKLTGRPGKQVKEIQSIDIEGKTNAEIQQLIKG